MRVIIILPSNKRNTVKEKFMNKIWKVDQLFTNLYTLQKTLRFELKPVGETEEHIKAYKLLERDQQRADYYEIVKGLIDDYHKWFIGEVLNGVEFDWTSLQTAINKHRLEKSKESKQKLEAKQKEFRVKITNAFKSNKKYEYLFNEKLFDNLSATTNEERKAIDGFKRFSTYFTGFHENRKNMYSADDIATGVPFRIVHDNFPKFLNNADIYDKISNNPEIVEEIENSLKDVLKEHGLSLKSVFSIENYNKVLTQAGIDVYNLIIGGISHEDRKQKTQGINEIINLYCQKHPGEKISKMTLLFKQILSDRERYSFIPKMFENDSDVQNSISEFYKNELLKFKQGDNYVDVLKELAKLVKGIEQFDLANIHVTAASLTELSKTLFEEWSALQCYIERYVVDVFKTKKDQSKFLKSEIFSLAELNAVLERNEQSERIQSVWLKRADELHQDIVDAYTNVKNVLGKEYSSENKLRENSEDIALIKGFLDLIMEFMHWLKPLCTKAEITKDESFYNEFEPLYLQLSLIVPLYNKVRNYMTQKFAETKKIKLNFDNPTLADGWDKNKEKDNTSILLLKDGKYYLGILNAKNKPNIDVVCTCEQNEACYTKMVYKLLPGPNKMLPKVFFSIKGREIFKPSPYILEGYEAKKHKKGDAFNKKFCHELIDFFKGGIQQHPDWKFFDFKFSNTNDYEDISGFYREIQQQGYKITFTNIPERIVTQWVNEGSLYLFQLSNKDFAAGATGKPNLHTLYWTQLFSPENLKDVVVKLNGEAELFYRKKVIEKVFAHRVGKKMVNRRAKNGKAVPEKIFGELFHYFNAPEKTELSAEAEVWKSEVIVKTVKHKIVKDRRYTQDKYLFHVPLTLNFKAENKPLNDQVRTFLTQNSDINIIGIDRGERNLIYITIINQKGEIILQKSFNTIETKWGIENNTVSVDYLDKLVQREKERDAARKSWQTIGKIAELKEGYLSQVVHEISKLMIKNNAIIILEDLNFGFKRGRFKVERQVYQKFEKALIDKLNYLVFKDRGASEMGGVLKGYQFTEPVAALKDIGKQTGLLFYVPAAYTSKIDPTTGFTNLLNLNYDNEKKSKEFFSTVFDSIRYNAKESFFEFDVNYEKANTHETDYKKKWKVCTTNELRYAFNPTTRKTEKIMVTERFKALFAEHKIVFEGGRDIKQDIVENGNAKFYRELMWLLKLVMQMRNSNAETGEDYILSPVRNETMTFFDSRKVVDAALPFDSRKVDATLPKDADANGAYHIALKGLYLLHEVFNKAKADENKLDLKISHSDWLAFAQKRHK